VLSGLLKLKKMIESDHTVNLCDWNLQKTGDLQCDVARYVGIMFLYLMKHHDEISRTVFPFQHELPERIRENLRLSSFVGH
jgi:hypothetical protein